MATQNTVLAESVNGVCSAARNLKGMDLEDPDDPNLVADRELQAAVTQIEQSAKRLADVKLKSHASGQEMNFEDVILSAAQGITNATASLLGAAQVTELFHPPPQN